MMPKELFLSSPLNCSKTDATNELPPSFYCDTFAAPTDPTAKAATVNTYKYCSAYFSGVPIFATDDVPQVALARYFAEPRLTTLVGALSIGLPQSCFQASVELVCKTVFNPCKQVPQGAIGNPGTYLTTLF